MDFQETTPEPEAQMAEQANKPANTTIPSSSFQAKKRIWTVAIICLLGIGLIAACIKAIEPTTTTQTKPSTEQLAVDTPTAVEAVAEEPVATKEEAAAAAPAEVSTTEATTTTEAATAGEDTTGEDTTGADATSEDTTANPALDPVVATASYKDVPVGFTAEGYPFRGSPDAPVLVYEYSDFQCPFCSRYFVQTEPAINESFVRAGTLRVVFRDLPLVELHPNAPAAHQAANCLAKQGAEFYWAMHDALFRSQQEWSSLPDPLPVFKRMAGEIKADEAGYDACMSSGETQPQIESSVQEAYGLGFSGTPSFRFFSLASGEHFDLIGAQPYEQFQAYIEKIAAGEAPVDPQAQQSGGSDGIPFWATAEGLKPDPDRPGVNMAGDYYRGDLNAPVTVIEFSDFQCPYCRRHTTETQPALDEQFVDTNKVLWVFKNFPLSIHPQAPAAAVAAECAGNQEKFWEMSDLLFSDPGTWSISEPNPIFSGYAKQLELDTAAFDACLLDPEIQKRVESDMSDGSALVRGTPSFVILKDGQGRIIPGALPQDQFITALDEVVTKGFTQ